METTRRLSRAEKRAASFTRLARSAPENQGYHGQSAPIDVIRQRYLAHVHFQDLLTTANIRQTDHDLAVETTWTQQRRIQYVRTVGGGDDDDAFIAFKPSISTSIWFRVCSRSS